MICPLSPKLKHFHLPHNGHSTATQLPIATQLPLRKMGGNCISFERVWNLGSFPYRRFHFLPFLPVAIEWQLSGSRVAIEWPSHGRCTRVSSFVRFNLFRSAVGQPGNKLNYIFLTVFPPPPISMLMARSSVGLDFLVGLSLVAFIGCQH